MAAATFNATSTGAGGSNNTTNSAAAVVASSPYSARAAAAAAATASAICDAPGVSGGGGGTGAGGGWGLLDGVRALVLGLLGAELAYILMDRAGKLASRHRAKVRGESRQSRRSWVNTGVGLIDRSIDRSIG